MNPTILAILNELPALIGLFKDVVAAIIAAYKTANQPAVSDDDLTAANADMNAAYAALQAELASHVSKING